MNRRSLLCAGVRWALTVLALLGIVACTFSTRRAVLWHDAGSRYEIGLEAGGLMYAWRPSEWEGDGGGALPNSGWTVAEYGGGTESRLWFESSRTKQWQGLLIPLWMPCTPAALLAGVAWYADRRRVAERARRFAMWSLPSQPVRLSWRLVLLFCVVQAVGAVAFVCVVDSLVQFFGWEAKAGVVLERLAPVLLLSTPACGLLWAWAFVHLIEGLRRKRGGTHCLECGYDLTGNVSGCCPECGRAMELRP